MKDKDEPTPNEVYVPMGKATKSFGDRIIIGLLAAVILGVGYEVGDNHDRKREANIAAKEIKKLDEAHFQLTGHYPDPDITFCSRCIKEYAPEHHVTFRSRLEIYR
jgi:hypothetical protein